MIATFGAIPAMIAIPLAAGRAWKHLECHQDGCHRLGRFTHGHYRLCHVHHPHVPSDGKITAEHIAQVDVAAN